ncbi:MAG: hypothetical protein ABIF10_00810 [Candidatus Woesearchaeota archaeon]
MGAWFLRALDKPKELHFQKVLAEAYSCLNNDDFAAAKAKYVDAHQVLSRMSGARRQVFTSQLKSLYDQLHLLHKKNLLQDSAAKTDNALDKLNLDLSRIEESTTRMYVDFLMKEKQYNRLVSEVQKEKADLEAARAELEIELHNFKAARLCDTNQSVISPMQKFHSSLAILDSHLKNCDIKSALIQYSEIRAVYSDLGPDEKAKAFDLLLPRIRNLSPEVISELGF